MGWIIAGSIIVFLIAVVFIVAYITYRIAFYSSKKRVENVYDFPDDADFAVAKESMTKLIDELQEIPFEWVEITSFDGLKLRARYYEVKKGAPLQIQFHGYRGTSLRDFCGGNKLARESGHNTLLVDQRGAGKSEGTTLSFGVKERFDCLAWVNYAVERFGEEVEIYLSGVSMGASTVLMATEFELPKNVKGVIADCPYSSPEEVVKKVCKERGFPPKIFFPFLELGARVFGGFSIKGCSAKEAVKHTQVPILLIHGEADGLVPCEMSKEIYKNNPQMIRLELFPKAGHGISYTIDPKRYEKIVKEFLNSY